MSATAPQTLTPGRRYLIRRGRWSSLLEEARVIAKTKTGVYIEDGHGNRGWHMLADAGVGQWVIEEDLGPWNPHKESDEAAELRAALVLARNVISDCGLEDAHTVAWQAINSALAAPEGQP